MDVYGRICSRFWFIVSQNTLTFISKLNKRLVYLCFTCIFSEAVLFQRIKHCRWWKIRQIIMQDVYAFILALRFSSLVRSSSSSSWGISSFFRTGGLATIFSRSPFPCRSLVCISTLGISGFFRTWEDWTPFSAILLFLAEAWAAAAAGPSVVSSELEDWPPFSADLLFLAEAWAAAARPSVVSSVLVDSSSVDLLYLSKYFNQAWLHTLLA